MKLKSNQKFRITSTQNGYFVEVLIIKRFLFLSIKTWYLICDHSHSYGLYPFHQDWPRKSIDDCMKTIVKYTEDLERKRILSVIETDILTAKKMLNI